MPEASRDTVQLITGLVSHMRQIVGEGACYAMLHYGAMEEGKRIGAGAGDLTQILARLDVLLLQRTEIIHDEGTQLSLRVHSSSFIESDQRALHGIILGLVEGALTASRAGRYKGTIVPRPGELVLELKREG